MKRHIAAALFVCLMASPSVGQGAFILPNLERDPENALCPDAPVRPDWIAAPDPGVELSQADIAGQLYRQQGYLNVIEAGKCTCDLRFPSWDEVVAVVESEFPNVTRHEYLDAIYSITQSTKSYRSDAKAICKEYGIW